MFVDRSAILWDLDPSKLSSEQIEVLANHFLKRALGTDDPQILAEARRELEAGEPVVVETTAVEIGST